MSARTPEELARFFDSLAARGLMVDFAPEDEPKLARILGALDLAEGERVLEPGCGSGRLSALLVERAGPRGEVLALDVSPGMLRLAEARGLGPGFHVACALAEAVPRPGGHFDAALLFNVFPHFAEPAAVLREMKRVVRPGGRVLVAHLDGREGVNAFHAGASPEVADHQLPEAGTMRRLFEAAGLEVLELEEGPELYLLRARS